MVSPIGAPERSDSTSIGQAVNRSIWSVMSMTVRSSKPLTTVSTSFDGIVPGTTKPMVL